MESERNGVKRLSNTKAKKKRKERRKQKTKQKRGNNESRNSLLPSLSFRIQKKRMTTGPGAAARVFMSNDLRFMRKFPS